VDNRALLGDVPLGSLNGACILVVDDEEEIRAFLATVLTDEGAAVLEAADGDLGLEIARRSRPDLITLDLSMPGADGIEAFSRLRTTAETAQIPVCIVTGHPEYRKLIYDRPVTPPEGFVHKPCDPEHLVRTIRRIVGLAERKKTRNRAKPSPS
jgi:CheY-like chemotaxis protein